MWVRKADYEALRRRSEALEGAEAELARVERLARHRIAQELRRRVDAEQRAAQMADKLVAVAQRPVQVVQPPDTAAIVRQTVEGIATVLNGWRDNPQSQPQPQLALSMDAQGLDDRAGVPQSLEDFVPPWERDIPPPNQAEFVNARIGDYKPYIPGDGNTTPPTGGME